MQDKQFTCIKLLARAFSAIQKLSSICFNQNVLYIICFFFTCQPNFQSCIFFYLCQSIFLYFIIITYISSSSPYIADSPNQAFPADTSTLIGNVKLRAITLATGAAGALGEFKLPQFHLWNMLLPCQSVVGQSLYHLWFSLLPVACMEVVV